MCSYTNDHILVDEIDKTNVFSVFIDKLKSILDTGECNGFPPIGAQLVKTA